MLELRFTQCSGEQTLALDLNVPACGITAIFGVSGAGKTSLINALAGLTTPKSGRIALNGRVLYDHLQKINLPPEKRRVGYVFQDGRLFPHYRVRDNLLYGCNWHQRDRFDAMVALLGLGPLLDRFPHFLSGGEKQRVAIGRALLSAPDLLMMDEPLASLDLPRKRELLPWLKRLVHQFNVPLLYVSHSLDEILHLADNLLLLEQGKVDAFGSLEEVWNSNAMRLWLPHTEQSSVLRVQILEQHPDYAMTALSLSGHPIWVSRIALPKRTSLRIRIQATDVVLSLKPAHHSSIRNVVPAQVSALLDADDRVDVKLRIGQSELWAQISPWARDELMIKPYMWLFAQIKSVSICH